MTSSRSIVGLVVTKSHVCYLLGGAVKTGSVAVLVAHLVMFNL